MLPQFSSAKKFNYDQATSGVRMIIWGLFKKMVIADTFAVLANQYFSNPSGFDSISAWIGVLAFAIQIYGDFSGYSDIAMGCAKLLGFELMVNFKTPYFSKTFTEFWQRWHISLSTWFRDYVFIPLGGNRGHIIRYILNIMITFLLSGFWHGASYNFIIWGFLHGALLVVEKILLKVFPKFKGFSLIIFISVILCWVPFRAADLAQTVAAWSPLFSFNFIIEKFIYPLSIHNQLFLIPLALFVVIEFWINKLTFAEKVMKIPKAIRWVLYYTLILCILVFGDFNNAPTFIYFQF
jgi:D-alanyl-lipoteichoic acid acyltransferase DltB (MBOAT superfamily)